VRLCPAAGMVETALPFSHSTAIHAVMFRVAILLLVACAVAAAVEIPETLVVDGQTYKGVVYQSHDASRLRIMHETGIAAVPIAQVPAELRSQLGFDETAAAQAEAAFQQQQQQVEATRQAVAAQQSDNERRLEIAAKLNEKSIPVVGTIFQVVDGGILLESVVSTTGIVTSQVSAGNLLRPEAKKTVSKEAAIRKKIAPGDHVFVMTKQGGLVDGGQYSGVIYPMGTHSFTTVVGSGRTIPAFSDDLAAVSKFYGLD
jgi:hypothetical protein